jgi:hypothetical protein
MSDFKMLPMPPSYINDSEKIRKKYRRIKRDNRKLRKELKQFRESMKKTTKESNVKKMSDVSNPEKKCLPKWHCSDCDKDFANKGKYDVHRTVHHENGILVCAVCHAVQKTQNAVYAHGSKSHKEWESVFPKWLPFSKDAAMPENPDMACLQCFEVFSCRSERMSHEKEVHGLDLFAKYKK